MKLIYTNNSITIKKINHIAPKAIYNLWNLVRDDVHEWVSDFRLNKPINNKRITEIFQWKGMSTWWMNSLSMKDSEQNNRWIHRIMVLYICKEYFDKIEIITDDKTLVTSIKINFPRIKVLFVNNTNQTIKKYIKYNLPTLKRLLMLIFSLFKHIEIALLLFGMRKQQLNRIRNIQPTVWFRSSYPANWIKNGQGEWIDCHIKNAPLLDKKYKQTAGYLIYILKYVKDKDVGFLELWKKLRELKDKADRVVIFPEAHLRSYDILECYYSTFIEHQNFVKLKKYCLFKKMFIINSIDMSNILLEEWENNYYYEMQYNKLHSLSLVRFLKDIKRPQTIVTYGEFFVQSRYSYFGAKKLNTGNKFVALQHAMHSKNMMFTYFTKNEVNIDAFVTNNNYLPVPDYFLVQGEQYKSLLETFYSNERTHLIGSLKIDELNDLLKKSRLIREKLINDYDLIDKTVILLAPSINDYKNILFIISKIKNQKNIEILLRPHPVMNIEEIKLIHKKLCPDLTIKYITNETTYNLLTVASLVICSYSTIAIEAAIFGVRSVRTLPLGSFPLFEEESVIPSFRTPNQFLEWFRKQSWNEEIQLNNRQKLRTMVNRYFYKIDGKSADRLWEFLIENPDLPHNKNYNYAA